MGRPEVILPRHTRRRFLAIGGSATTAALLAACAPGGADSGGPKVPPAPPGTGFPITVTDKFGPVTIPAPPATIASVGRTDHDVLLALGIIPASVYQFVPRMTRGVGVWAEPKLGSARPLVVTAPPRFELIAGLRPDLILNVQSSGDESDYRTLRQIAPTVGLPPNTTPSAVSWQDSARLISTAVGRQRDGEALVAATEASLADAARQNPGFAGRTVTVLLGYGSQIAVFSLGDVRTQVLAGLGLTPSRYVAGLDRAKFYHDISPELLEEANADVVLVLTREGLSAADTFGRFPALANTSAAAQKRMVVLEDFDVALALACASVLSIPFAVTGLVTALRKVLG